MDHNLDNVAQELYGKIRTRFSNVRMGDETGEVLSKKEDIPRARFFEFEYAEAGQPLGTITITLDSDDGVVVQASGDLIKNRAGNIYKFFKSLSQFAKDKMLNIKIDNIGKSNLDKRDYEFQAKRKEDTIMENKMFGTAKISYQDLGEARLIVKHSQPINTELPAGRTMHIENIYIENAQGERFRYPYKHLNGARALAEHIKNGGTPYDDIGRHISGLSEELGQLRKFKNYVGRQEQISEAMGDITSKVMERIDAVKKEIHNLQRPTYYKQFAESFTTKEERQIPEEIMNDWVDRLTIRTFNEELKSVFPYIYNIVDESELPIVELGVDDIIGEVFDGDKETGTTHKGGVVTKTKHGIKHTKTDYDDGHGEKGRKPSEAGPKSRYHQTPILDKDDDLDENSLNAEMAFESFIDSIIAEDDMGEDTLFSPNKDTQNAAIEKLNDIIGTELKGGPEGTNAIQSLKGIIDDPEFAERLKDNDPDLDTRALIYDYVSQRAPEILTQLDFPASSEDKGPAEEPAASAPAPEAPAPTPAPAAAAPAEPMPAPAPAPVAEEASQADVRKADNSASQPFDSTKRGPNEPNPAPSKSSQADVRKVDNAMAKQQEWEKALGSKEPKNWDYFEEEDPPFDPDPKPHGKTTPGKHGQGYSQARHLARQGLQKAIANAKKAGATLDTKLDFGHKAMTLQDAIEECGLTPMECGFEPQETGIDQMLKYISGFYNKDEGNFPLGGQRVKIKVKKAFEDGEFNNASPEELLKVIKLIDLKDPSGNEHNQIMRLAGVNHREEVEEAGEMPDIDSLMKKLQSQVGNVKSTSTSTGSINGQPATYDDAMSKFQNMKLKFGDDEIDFSNPDQAGEKMKGVMGGMMKGMQGQVPNQNIQFPGGQMNPNDMMKAIMQKINFGN